MAPGKKKGVSNKVRKSTVGSRLGGSSSGVVTKTLGMRAMEQERARTSALVETQIAGTMVFSFADTLVLIYSNMCKPGLSERQAKLLEEGRNINLAEHDGYIIDVDMENNTADGSNDGPNWVDEGEVYLDALQSTVYSRCVVHN